MRLRAFLAGRGEVVGVSRSLGSCAGSAHKLAGSVVLLGVSMSLGICAGSAHKLLGDSGVLGCVLDGSGVSVGVLGGSVAVVQARFRHLPYRCQIGRRLLFRRGRGVAVCVVGLSCCVAAAGSAPIGFGVVMFMAMAASVGVSGLLAGSGVAVCWWGLGGWAVATCCGLAFGVGRGLGVGRSGALSGSCALLADASIASQSMSSGFSGVFGAKRCL